MKIRPALVVLLTGGCLGLAPPAPAGPPTRTTIDTLVANTKTVPTEVS